MTFFLLLVLSLILTALLCALISTLALNLSARNLAGNGATPEEFYRFFHRKYRRARLPLIKNACLYYMACAHGAMGEFQKGLLEIACVRTSTLWMRKDAVEAITGRLREGDRDYPYLSIQ